MIMTAPLRSQAVPAMIADGRAHREIRAQPPSDRLAPRRGRHTVSDVKVDTVRSRSSGVVGRAISNARNHHFILDSSTAPEALSNSEAFLAAVSSCGVTLVEGRARDIGVPLQRMEVTIEGARAAEPRFQHVTMRFVLHGVDQATAEALIETYKAR